MKTTFKQTSLALAMGLLGLGAASTAHAGVYTFASDQVTLQLFDGNGGGKGAAIDATDFSSLSAQDSSSTQADLASVAGVANNSALTSGNSLQSIQVNSGAAPGENSFSPAGTGSWFARSDTNVSGSTITGLAVGAPATSNVISEISLLGNDVGQANANAANNTGFIFSVANGNQSVFLDLTASTSTRTLITADQSTPPSIAGSTKTWLVTITDNTDGSTVFSWSPDAAAGGILGGTELSDTIDLGFGSTLSSAGDTGLISKSGAATALTPVLLAGRNYTFRIVDTTSSNALAQAGQAPEPSIIGMMGFGLLGLAVARAKRNKA